MAACNCGKAGGNTYNFGCCACAIRYAESHLPSNKSKIDEVVKLRIFSALAHIERYEYQPGNPTPKTSDIRPGEAVCQHFLAVYGINLRDSGLLKTCEKQWVEKAKAIKNGAYAEGSSHHARKPVKQVFNDTSENFDYGVEDFDYAFDEGQQFTASVSDNAPRSLTGYKVSQEDKQRIAKAAENLKKTLSQKSPAPKEPSGLF